MLISVNLTYTDTATETAMPNYKKQSVEAGKCFSTKWIFSLASEGKILINGTGVERAFLKELEYGIKHKLGLMSKTQIKYTKETRAFPTAVSLRIEEWKVKLEDEESLSYRKHWITDSADPYYSWIPYLWT